MQIVVPALNEAERIGPMLLALRRFACERAECLGDETLEVIVVDNGSDDDTAEQALAHSSSELPVRVIHCPTRGKGIAVRTGMLATTHDIVGFMDADGATDEEAIIRAIEMVRSGNDIVIGSRAVSGSQVTARETAMRAWGSAAFRLLSRLIVPGIADTQCGFKIFRGHVAHTLFRRLTLTGFVFDVEILALALLHQFRMAEIPVRWTDKPGSKFVASRHGLGAFVSLVRLAWTTRKVQVEAEPHTTRPMVLPVAATAPEALVA